MPHLEICTRMTGDGTSTTLLRAVIGLEIRMQSITCVRKHPKLSLSLSHMACHSAEPRRERSINVPSVGNPLIMETVDKLTVAVP